MKARNVWSRWGSVAALVAALALGAQEADAQQWSWPERAENLQELPADFPAQRLSAVMRGFTNALGVRCVHCHVGEEGQPLSTFDFVSDENPNKDRARAMLRMLGVINEHLDEIEPSGERVNMWCHTCHQGKPRPQTLEETLTERYESEGPEAALAHFTELRERYYGGPQYDFTPLNVGTIAVGLFQQGDTATAERLFEINLQNHPDSWEAHEGMGDIMRVTGQTDEAIRHYEHALELSPENPRVTAKLGRIR